MLFDWPLIGARWLHFLALAMVFGGSLFHLLVAPPSWRDEMESRLVKIAAWMALASGLAWIAASLVAMTDDIRSLVDPGTLAAFFRDTGFGRVWVARLVLLVVLAGVASWPIQLDPPRHSGWLAMLAGMALVTQAWLGHAAMGQGGAAISELASYMAHVLAASAWLGALLPLAFLLAERGGLDAPARHAALLRFSHFGMAAVALILASGIANCVFRLASPYDLVQGAYGRTLLAKVALFLAMLAIAVINRWRLMPKLRTGDAGALAALRRNVLIEQMLGILVLGAAALLGTLPPQG